MPIPDCETKSSEKDIQEYLEQETRKIWGVINEPKNVFDILRRAKPPASRSENTGVLLFKAVPMDLSPSQTTHIEIPIPETVFLRPEGKTWSINGLVEAVIELKDPRISPDKVKAFSEERLPGWTWDPGLKRGKKMEITGTRVFDEKSFVSSFASLEVLAEIQNQLERIGLVIP